MRLNTLLAMAMLLVLVGCQPKPEVQQPEELAMKLIWREAETYNESNLPAAQILGEKDTASGKEVLEGKALAAAGDTVVYEVDLPMYIADASLHVRYARLHWMEMSPSEVELHVINQEKTITRTFMFGNTGGWGSSNPADWAIASTRLGEMKPGKWQVKLIAKALKHGDVCLDGFFLAPSEYAFTTEEFAGLDRIDISSYRYVGVEVDGPTIRQDQFDGVNVVARAFTPATRDVTVTLLGGAGVPAAVMLDEKDLAIDNKVMHIHADGGILTELPDASYVIRTHWRGSLILDYPVYFAGELAGDFETRLEAIKEFAGKIEASSDEFDHRFAADFQHAIEYLESSFAKINDGSAGIQLLNSISRTLEQYEYAKQMIVLGKEPFNEMTGDQRRAYVSAQSGEVEPYRIVLPDSYTPESKLPMVLSLNHNENAYLDRGEGVVQKLYNERGYVILSPRSNHRYRAQEITDLVQLVEHVVKEYPGIDAGRIYGTGVSAGGFATYRIATRYPDFYTAIACASGTGNWSLKMEDRWHVLREKFAPVPTLILHGEADDLVPVHTVRTVAEHLDKLDIPYELHTFANHGHSYHAYAEQYVRLTLDYFDKYK